MKITGFLFGDSKSEAYYNMQVGSATIEGESTQEIIEKAQAIINSPFEAQKKYLNPTGARVTEPFPLRMELTISGEGSRTIRKKKPRKKDEMMRGGLDALIGGGSRPAAGTEAEQTPAPEQDVTEGATLQEEEDLINSIEDEELKAALQRRRASKSGRPRKDAALRVKESELYTRSCWIIRRDLLAKLKEISFRETLTLKEIMEQITENAIEAYEKKHGEVVPTSHRGDASNLFK